MKRVILLLWVGVLSAGPVEFVESVFPEKEVEVAPLSGGLSAVSMYKVKAGDRDYVLRVYSGEMAEQDRLEIEMLVEASKRGLSPEVVAKSEKMLLMEFVSSPTLKVDEAKGLSQKLGQALREVHQMPKPERVGESMLSKATRCREKVLADGLVPAEDIEEAYGIVKALSEDLEGGEKRTLHGDLNLRNLFCHKGRILFIDWAETTVNDPLMDLSYLSLKAAFEPEEDRALLTAYYGEAPTDEVLSRFEAQKRRHHAFWSLTDLYLADVELKKHPGQSIDPKASLKSWESYQVRFANNEPLDAQYFIDLSRLNLKLARP